MVSQITQQSLVDFFVKEAEYSPENIGQSENNASSPESGREYSDKVND